MYTVTKDPGDLCAFAAVFANWILYFDVRTTRIKGYQLICSRAFSGPQGRCYRFRKKDRAPKSTSSLPAFIRGATYVTEPPRSGKVADWSVATPRLARNAFMRLEPHLGHYNIGHTRGDSTLFMVRMFSTAGGKNCAPARVDFLPVISLSYYRETSAMRVRKPHF